MRLGSGLEPLMLKYFECSDVPTHSLNMHGKLHAEQKPGRTPVEVHFEGWRVAQILAEKLSFPEDSSFIVFDY